VAVEGFRALEADLTEGGASPGGCAMESRRRVTFAQPLRIYCNPAGSLILDT
jgi:hypothetical protein